MPLVIAPLVFDFTILVAFFRSYGIGVVLATASAYGTNTRLYIYYDMLGFVSGLFVMIELLGTIVFPGVINVGIIAFDLRSNTR